MTIKMLNISTLDNGLTLITIPIPHLDSVTTLVGVGAGSRYESKKINGISHFLEHMFFKGSKKYPTAEIISTLVDSVGAVNNAGTSKEYTYYWIKSAARHIELSTDLLSSMVKESLLDAEEIEREKGVIVEELRMYKDTPSRYVLELYENLVYGDQPLGWDIGGEEDIVNKLTKDDFVKYMASLYTPENMVLVYAGKLPENIEELASRYFNGLTKSDQAKFQPFKSVTQDKPKVNIYYKDTDQANLVLGVRAYDRNDQKRYAARVLAAILGEGMSSRLFIQVRERRGLAYHVSADFDPYLDTGSFAVYSGMKLEKIEEGVRVIREELEKMKGDTVSEDELKKAKELIRGRIAIRSESTNFLAEHFATEFLLDREVESFEEYLKQIDAVTPSDLMAVAKELFNSQSYNLQIIAPLKDITVFEKILS